MCVVSKKSREDEGSERGEDSHLESVGVKSLVRISSLFVSWSWVEQHATQSHSNP